MVKKKKLDSKQTHKWDSSSPIIAEKYPNVKSLTIKMVFSYEEWGQTKISQKSRTWNVPITQTRAYIYENCPMWECVNGGFDLTHAVALAIENGEHHAHSTLECQGWEDKERIGQYRCLTELHYDIYIEYK